METMIKKKQRKKGLEIDADLASKTNNPFVEIDYYLSQPCLCV
jgi:hypothetical protein